MPLEEVGSTVNEFQVIGEDPGKFAAFVNAHYELSEQTKGVQGEVLPNN